MDDSVKKYKIRRKERVKKRLDDFTEGDHPRDESGRFSSGGGGKKVSNKNLAVRVENLPRKIGAPKNGVVRIKKKNG